MTTLSKEDKTSIINQHKRNLEYSKYNIQLSIIEENSLTSPSTSIINGFNAQIAEFDSKLAALDQELASLE
jgi:hypothetical protein